MTFWHSVCRFRGSAIGMVGTSSSGSSGGGVAGGSPVGSAAGGSLRRAAQQLADKVLFTVDANSDVLSSRISEVGNGKGPTDGHFQKQKLPIIEAKKLDKISVRTGCGCGAGGGQDEEPEEGGGAGGRSKPWAPGVRFCGVLP